jgi:predicted DsbA family dithiol-disulfide isomerase
LSAREEKETPLDTAAIARLDGKQIHLGDLNYDLRRRYDFELHTIKVKLYREQKAALKQFIDQSLLEKEAAKRNITTDELVSLINGGAEEEGKKFEADKEKLFQEFVKKLQHDFPSFSKGPSELVPPGPLTGLPPPGSGFRTPFIEEMKDKVVEMKKASYLNDSKEAFFQGLRAQAGIEILLERPELLRIDLAPDNDPWLGNKDAPITILSFMDFQCPYCKKMNSTLKVLLATKKEEIKIIARDFPLASHPDATMAAQASACAHDQGRYWDYHDLLFDNQQALDVMNLREYAGRLGINREQFSRCLEGGSQRAEVEKDMAEASLAGISSTPSILINGYYLSGSPSLHYMEEVIADIEKGHVPRVEEDPGKG